MFGYLFLPHHIWRKNNITQVFISYQFISHYSIYNVYIPLDVSKQTYFCCHGAMSPDCTPSSCKVRPSSNVTPAGGGWLNDLRHGPWWVSQQQWWFYVIFYWLQSIELWKIVEVMENKGNTDPDTQHYPTWPLCVIFLTPKWPFLRRAWSNNLKQHQTLGYPHPFWGIQSPG